MLIVIVHIRPQQANVPTAGARRRAENAHGLQCGTHSWSPRDVQRYRYVHKTQYNRSSDGAAIT
eukprot:SAG22_NODE_298_length_12785_cov_5.760129_7_plen_64_part_00